LALSFRSRSSLACSKTWNGREGGRERGGVRGFLILLGQEALAFFGPVLSVEVVFGSFEHLGGEEGREGGLVRMTRLT